MAARGLGASRRCAGGGPAPGDRAVGVGRPGLGGPRRHGAGARRLARAAARDAGAGGRPVRPRPAQGPGRHAVLLPRARRAGRDLRRAPRRARPVAPRLRPRRGRPRLPGRRARRHARRRPQQRGPRPPLRRPERRAARRRRWRAADLRRPHGHLGHGAPRRGDRVPRDLRGVAAGEGERGRALDQRDRLRGLAHAAGVAALLRPHGPAAGAALAEARSPRVDDRPRRLQRRAHPRRHRGRGRRPDAVHARRCGHLPAARRLALVRVTGPEHHGLQRPRRREPRGRRARRRSGRQP